MSYSTRVEDPIAFAERHNAQLVADAETKLRLANRNAWLENICRQVARHSIDLQRTVQVEVKLTS